MSLEINLPSSIEARLAEEAAAQGVDLETFAIRAIEESLADVSKTNGQGASEESVDEWVADLRNWAASHQPVNVFVDDSRESIYDGRGE